MIARFLLPAAVAALVCGSAGAQMPQRTEPPSPTAPLSLQSQLGAIPLVSPRAQQQALRVRPVRVTQLGEDGAPVGEVRELACAQSGCQQPLALLVGGRPRPFMTDIQFVSGGAYLSLHTRAVEVGAVVEFEKGRRGPQFLKARSDATIGQTLRYSLAPSATLRRLDLADDGRTLAAGNVYTRKLAPDLVLKVEIGLAQEPQR